MANYDVIRRRISGSGPHAVYPLLNGDEPDLLIAMCSNAAWGTVRNEGAFSVGAYDGTTAATIGTDILHNATESTANCATWSKSGAVTTVFQQQAGGADPQDTPAYGAITSWGSSPSQFQYDADVHYDNYDVGFLCMSGVDAKVVTFNAPSSTSVSNHTCGFEPAALLLFGCRDTTAWGASSNVGLYASLTMGASDGTNHWSNAYTAYDSGAAEDHVKQISSVLGRILTIAGSNDIVANSVAFTATGFNIDWTVSGAGGGRFFAVAIGNCTAKVWNDEIPTSTGQTTYSIPGIYPRALLFGSATDSTHTAALDECGAFLQAYTGYNDSGYFHNWQQRLETKEATASNGTVESYQNAAYNKHLMMVRNFSQVTEASSITLQNEQIVVDYTTVDVAVKKFWNLSLGDPAWSSGWTNRGRYNRLKATHDGTALPSNYYIALVTGDTAPGPDTNTLSDLTEIAAGNGYTSGGIQLSLNTTDFESAVESDASDYGLINLRNLNWTASGGAIPSSGNDIAFAVLTDDNGTTVGARNVLYYWYLKAERTVLQNEILTLDLSISLREPA